MDILLDKDTKNPLHRLFMGTSPIKTTAKLHIMSYRVVEIWEHEFLKQKKKDVELEKFLQTMNSWID